MHSSRTTAVEVTHGIAVVEAGLRAILGAFPEFDVRPAAPPGTLAVEPDVVVADPDAALQRVARRGPQPNVLVIAMPGQDADVRTALEAGVRGYVVCSSADEVVVAVRAVSAGRRYLCSAATLRVADSLGQPALTLREGDVLGLVLRGQSNKEIARALGIAEGTVKAHMRALLTKLGARCRTEALWIATQRGFVMRTAAPAPERDLDRAKPLRGDGFGALMDAPDRLVRAAAHERLLSVAV